jgi:hypothetical protein
MACARQLRRLAPVAAALLALAAAASTAAAVDVLLPAIAH